MSNIGKFILFTCFVIILFGCERSKIVFEKEPIVRVKILEQASSLILISANEMVATTSESSVQHPFASQDTIHLSIVNGLLSVSNSKNQTIETRKSMVIRTEGEFKLLDIPYGVGWWWEGKEHRVYEGELAIYLEDSTLKAVIHVPLETYVKGVIPYEIGVDTPMEALKAQALAARTEVVKALVTGKYKGAQYDLCADVDCQVFAGNKKRTTRTDSAVVLTKGEVIYHESELIDAYFASNCGGMSEVVEKVWPWRGGPKAYLKAQFDGESPNSISPQTEFEKWWSHSPDTYCNPKYVTELPAWSRNHFRWERNVNQDEFDLLFKNLDSIKVRERGESGRIHRAMIWKEGSETLLTYELAVRKLLVPPLKSSAFTVENINERWKFKGAGWGHGVGMCQSGAVGRAIKGHTYLQILNHYYPGTAISKSY